MRFLLFPLALVVFGLALHQNAEASLAGSTCSGHEFAVDPKDCGLFYQCVHGRFVQLHCSGGLHFNLKTHACDFPKNVHCGELESVIPITAPASTTAHHHTTTAVPVTTVRTTTAAPTTAAPTTTTRATTTAPTTTTRATTTTQSSTSPGALISHAEFLAAAATKHGHPDRSYYDGFIKSLPKASITTRREAILFLAHTVWETVGLLYTKEVYCQTHNCLSAYPNNAGGLPGRIYYGRGMMQLTWDYNYNAASLYLYGDLRLLENPDVVGEDPSVGWATAAWYWHANVHDRSTTFGQTLKAINGALECDGGPHGQNRYLRFMHYKQILTLFHEPQPSDDDGWCTAW